MAIKFQESSGNCGALREIIGSFKAMLNSVTFYAARWLLGDVGVSGGELVASCCSLCKLSHFTIRAEESFEVTWKRADISSKEAFTFMVLFISTLGALVSQVVGCIYGYLAYREAGPEACKSQFHPVF